VEAVEPEGAEPEAEPVELVVPEVVEAAEVVVVSLPPVA